jgi:hypothetical protein
VLKIQKCGFITFLSLTGVLGVQKCKCFHALWFATVPVPNVLDFSQYRCDTRVWRRAKPAERRLRRLLANRFAVCAKRAEREKFAALGVSRECWGFRSASAFTRFGLQQFRC